MLLSLGELLKTLTDFTLNAALLLALLFLYSLTNLDPRTNSIKRKAIYGIVIGLFSIIIMLTAWKNDGGLSFDARSVLFSITGLFFGPITTIIAAVIGIAFRMTMWNGGLISGVLTIIGSSAIGLYWHKINKALLKLPLALKLFFFSLITHIFVLLCFFTIMPFGSGWTIIKSTAHIYLVLYPLISMLISLALHDQRKRLDTAMITSQQKQLLQASIDSNLDVEIYALDKNFKYLTFNQFHAKSMKQYNNCDIAVGMDFISLIKDQNIAKRLQDSFSQVMLGTRQKVIVEAESGLGQFLEEIYTPIFDDENQVIGLTVFSQDVTKQKQYQESMVYMSYHDALTGLMNRRYFTEQIELLDKRKDVLPLTIVQCDINGLKIMNDAFGHDSGDELLVLVANALRKCFKDQHYISRLGGDEFVVTLKNTSTAEAQVLVTKLQKYLETVNLFGLSVSVSCGIKTKYDDESIHNVIRAAEEEMYQQKLFEITNHRNKAVKSIIKTLHEKSPREKKHAKRVSELCVLYAESNNMKEVDVKSLRLLGELHNIGKISVDADILNKKTTLTDSETEIIKRHSEIGYRILVTTSEYAEIAFDVLSMYEQYDGNGYPRGLKGNKIPLRARIIAVIDVFDIMTSDYNYEQPMSVKDALTQLEEGAGTLYDPQVVKNFVKTILDSTQNLAR